MKLQKMVLFWITTVVILVSIFATSGAALASAPRVNSNAAIYPMAISPSLGAAQSFAVLGASAVTNVPTSAITGDVGLSPAAGSNYAGLTTAEVTGTIFAVDATGPAGSVNNPVLLNNAQIANTAAFLALSAGANAACDTNYGAITKDLVGLTLVPGVYCADAFALSGTLILDDTGNADGVWIFRSELSTLVTSAGVGAKVQFLNGIGSPCNVWWKVASSATIGSGTTFIGNILALTMISLGTDATLNGRALAQTGAVTMDSNTVSVLPCGTPTPPPVVPPPEGPPGGPPGGFPGGAPSVGITVMPVDKGGLLIPWLGMAGLLLLATGAGLFIRRRTSR
jgi:hypothetical protein